MKNLKLSWELSSNLQLQSPNEVIRCTAFDIEQNRFFFASSDNLIYTLPISSSQNEESHGSSSVIETVDLDAGDFITSMEYVMEKESLIIGTSSGDLLLYNVDDSAMEVVGRVEGGVKSISPSPDGDLLCIITGIGQMLVMTHDWDLLYETPLEEHIEDTDTRDQGLHSECTPGSPATWRGDGKFFATITSTPTSSHKKLKVWERDTGNTHSVSEPKASMGEIAEWMPSGAKIATVCDNKIVFFEKNGLERSSFTAIDGIDATLVNLKWNCNSDLLAAVVRTKTYDSIKIWFFSNNYWYLKQEIRYSKHDGVRFMWDPVKPLSLISWTLEGVIKVYNFIWISSVTDNSVALVVDGSKILVTPLSLSLIPPPMYLFELRFPCSVRETAFWSKNSKNSLAVSLTDGSLSVVELPELDTWQDLEGEVIHVELCITEDLSSFVHLTWLDSRVLLGVILEPSHTNSESPKYYIQELELVCSEDHIPGSVTGSGFDANVVNKLPVESTVIGLVSNPVKKRSAFLQFNGGNIFEYETNFPLHERSNLRFSSSCPWMSVGPIEDSDVFLLFGLDNNGKLHVNQTILCNNCSSFSLYSNNANQTITHLILATKQDLLFVVEIRDIVLGQTEVKYGNFLPVVLTRKNAEEGKKFIQIWEKGSKILGVVHGDESTVIIQTTRGNLESIYPRKLVLESIVNALVQGRFRDSLLMVRRHRIDFNIIVDHRGWQEFVKSATEFVKQVDNLSYITEFVCSLKNENIMETLYKGYISYTNEENGTLGGQSKVNSVLLAVRKALEEQIVESPARELCILTTLARSDPPYLEEALERVKVTREMELLDCDGPERKRVPSSEESLKHLLWLSESEAVFEAALGLYDLNLAAIVALNSQQDPKEFLPFLQELEILPVHIMRYKIDLKLRRFEKALQHIVAAGDTYFEDCINLVKNNPQLFSRALQLITDATKKKQVLEAWGDQLTNTKCFEDAATTYLCCNNLEKALKSYRSSNNWGGVLKSTSVSERFRWSHRRNGSKNSSSGRVWGKEMEARLKGISMGGGEGSVGTLSASASGRRPDPIVLEEENEPKEWVAQVEPGVLITFVSLPRGGNDLKRIRFSREMFNKWQAQKWWQENYDKVMELYNVQRLNRQAFPLPTTPRSEDEGSMKFECNGDSPITPPLNKERLPRTLYRPMGTGYSSSDSLDHQSSIVARSNRDSSGLTATPKLSSISGTKTETSSVDASIRTSSSREADRSGELSISNVSDTENEWVEQDEPGVYITIKALPGGLRELKRVRFSREQFGEVHARLWWEENRARIHKQYL